MGQILKKRQSINHIPTQNIEPEKAVTTRQMAQQAYRNSKMSSQHAMVFSEREISSKNLRRVIEEDGGRQKLISVEQVETQDVGKSQDEALRKAAQQVANTIAIMDKRQIKTKTELQKHLSANMNPILRRNMEAASYSIENSVFESGTNAKST